MFANILIHIYMPCLFVNAYGILCHGNDYASSRIRGLNKIGDHIVYWFW